MSSRHATHPQAAARVGGATFQMLAFILAAGLGVWLGAQYLGVNVEHLAYTALDEADVLQKVPEGWRPEGPPPEVGEGEGQVRPAERAADLERELDAVKADLARLRDEAQLDSGDSTAEAQIDGQQDATEREATIAYWTRLLEITSEVTAIHDKADPALNAVTAAQVFDVRRRAFAYGARAIDSIQRDDVDQSAIDAAFRIAKWQRDGAELYERAEAVWEGQSAQQPESQAAKTLEKLTEQHRMQAELVRDLSKRTAKALSRRHGHEFPPLDL